MKVIILKKTPKLGVQGDTVEVKEGYARNFLIPQGFALPATDKNFKRLQEIKRSTAKKAEKKKESFLGLKGKIDELSLTITAEAKEDEELYGAVNEARISKLLASEGIDLDKDKIVLDQPIKKLGVYNIKINLHPEVEAALRVWVMKK